MASCPRQTVKDFKRLVTMSPASIKRWGKDPRAKLASFASTRKRLPALAKLKGKPVNKWTAADCKFAKRVVSFNKRMLGMKKQHGCTVKIGVSLRNWGNASCPAPKKK